MLCAVYIHTPLMKWYINDYLSLTAKYANCVITALADILILSSQVIYSRTCRMSFG